VTPHDRQFCQALDTLANALQAAVLIAEQLREASAATLRVTESLIENLRRTTGALQNVLTTIRPQ
jgi:hypothetical protein